MSANIKDRLTRALGGVWHLYADGFRSMTIGRTLWAIILIKLAVMFLVLKIFFFPDVLAEKYDDDGARADAVRNVMTTR